MDPDVTLAVIRGLCQRILGRFDVTPEEATETAEDLAERVIALDEWLSKGGFLPSPWQKGR